MIQLGIICVYLCVLIGLGVLSKRSFRGTAQDFFLASRSIGPLLLLLSVFGTAMTAFSLVGSSGEAYRSGIGVYGLMASWSGLVHSAVFYFAGVRLWSIGKRQGYTTQIQFLSDRFESRALGLMLFPVLAGLVVPYVLIGLLGAGGVVQALTQGAFPSAFSSTGGGIPPWITGLAICAVVLLYIFVGGLRAAAWANALQAAVFIVTGVATFAVLSSKLGGMQAATQAVQAAHPEKLVRGDAFGQLHFASYGLIPLSIGMFPHVYQHWLTAKSASAFKPLIVWHPICMLIVWLPCVLIGVWATSAAMPDGSLVVAVGAAPNSELATMVQRLTSPLLGGILGAGILAAIMSSLDSQFLAIGSMFTNDIVVQALGKKRLSDAGKVRLGRWFVGAVATVAYLASLSDPRSVFTLGVWCFSGYASLFPIAIAAIYWKRATAAGAKASVLATVVVGWGLFRDSGYGSDPAYLFLDMLPVATMVTVSTATLIIVSLLTKRPSQQTLAKFFRCERQRLENRLHHGRRRRQDLRELPAGQRPRRGAQGRGARCRAAADLYPAADGRAGCQREPGRLRGYQSLPAGALSPLPIHRPSGPFPRQSRSPAVGIGPRYPANLGAMTRDMFQGADGPYRREMRKLGRATAGDTPGSRSPDQLDVGEHGRTDQKGSRHSGGLLAPGRGRLSCRASGILPNGVL